MVRASKKMLFLAAIALSLVLCGGGCIDVLGLSPAYTLCGPNGAGGCGGSGGDGGGDAGSDAPG
jgi:hypothetical protein